MENKKGIQLSQAFGAVLTLVLVAVLVIIAIFIFVSLETSFAGTSTVTVTNESVTIQGNGVSQPVGSAGNCSFAAFSPSAVINLTFGAEQIHNNNTLVETTDYVINASTGELLNVSEEWNVSWVTYTYTWGSEACTASDNMTDEFGNYTSLIGLVGTIIFLGLVIGVLVASFAFGGRREV